MSAHDVVTNLLGINAELRSENERAWSQYHSAMHEYALLREAYAALKEENRENYLRRKSAERLVASHRAEAVRRINEGL